MQNVNKNGKKLTEEAWLGDKERNGGSSFS